MSHPTSDKKDSVRKKLAKIDILLVEKSLANPAETLLDHEIIDTSRMLVLEEVAALDFSLKYAWFLQQISSMQFGFDTLYCIQYDFHRENLFSASIEKLNKIRPEHMCSVIRIAIAGEHAIDAGGVLREWYMIIAETLLDPEQG